MLIFENNIIYRKKKQDESHLDSMIDENRPHLEIPLHWEHEEIPLPLEKKEISSIIEIDLT